MNVEEHTRKHTRVGYFILVGCLVLTILLWLTGVTEAGTWNDKPVMCGPKEETDEVIVQTTKRNIDMLFVRGDVVILVSPPLRIACTCWMWLILVRHRRSACVAI